LANRIILEINDPGTLPLRGASFPFHHRLLHAIHAKDMESGFEHLQKAGHPHGILVVSGMGVQLEKWR
jgi:hypothetical protein